MAGTPGGTRTPDARLRTPPLYPLSYRGVGRGGWLWWWRQGGSNPQPRRCERRALPIELCPHGVGPRLRQKLAGFMVARRRRGCQVARGVIIAIPCLYVRRALGGFLVTRVWGGVGWGWQGGRPHPNPPPEGEGIIGSDEGDLLVIGGGVGVCYYSGDGMGLGLRGRCYGGFGYGGDGVCGG